MGGTIYGEVSFPPSTAPPASRSYGNACSPSDSAMSASPADIQRRRKRVCARQRNPTYSARPAMSSDSSLPRSISAVSATTAYPADLDGIGECADTALVDGQRPATTHTGVSATPTNTNESHPSFSTLPADPTDNNRCVDNNRAVIRD